MYKYIESYIRKQARSNYWLSIYRASKESNGIQIFKNSTNFSSLQINFLYWLKIYDIIYSELIEHEWDNLYEKTIEDDEILDAFLYWRSEQISKKRQEIKNEERLSEFKNRKNSSMSDINSHKIFSGARNKKEE